MLTALISCVPDSDSLIYLLIYPNAISVITWETQKKDVAVLGLENSASFWKGSCIRPYLCSLTLLNQQSHKDPCRLMYVEELWVFLSYSGWNASWPCALPCCGLRGQWIVNKRCGSNKPENIDHWTDTNYPTNWLSVFCSRLVPSIFLQWVEMNIDLFICHIHRQWTLIIYKYFHQLPFFNNWDLTGETKLK